MRIITIICILLTVSCETSTQNIEANEPVKLEQNNGLRSIYGIHGPNIVKIGKSALYSVRFESHYYFQIPIGAQPKVQWKVYQKTDNGYNLFYNYKNPNDKLGVAILAEEFSVLYATLGYWAANGTWQSISSSRKGFTIIGVD